jgi:PAS domain S-box-containing protein
MTKAELSQEVEKLRKRLAELRQTEETLRESEEKWCSLLNNTPDIVMIVSRDGTIRFINHTVPGFTLREATGKKVYDYISIEHHKTMRKDLEHIFQTGQSASHEISGTGPHGTSSWYRAELGPIKQDGCIVAASIITRDITEHRKADQSLEAAKEHAELIYRVVPSAIFTVDKERRITNWNNKAAEITGYTAEEVLGKKCTTIALKPCCYKCGLYSDDVKKPITNRECTIKTKDGKILTVLKNTDFLKDANGNITGGIESFEDITERRELEQTLRQKTEHLGERLKELDCLYRASKLMEQIDKPLEEILKELVQMVPLAWQYPDKTCARITFEQCEFKTDNFTKTPYKQCADIRIQEKKVGSLEVYYLGKKPAIHQRPFLKEEKELLDAIAVKVGSFVEGKRAEEVLRESEERYRALFQGAAEGIIVADVKTMKFKYVNPAICKMLGYSEKELKRLGVRDIHRKEDLEYVISEFKAQAQGEKISSPNIPCLRKDGKIIYTDINTTNVLIDGRSCNVGFFTDVTKRKKAEEEIEKFKEMADRATYGCAMSDLKGNLTYINDSFAKMHGYTPSELIGKNLCIFHTTAQMKSVRQQNKKLRQTGEGIKNEEIWHVHRDGTEFPTLMSTWILTDIKGNTYQMCATAIDITESKKAEIKLRESEERYRILVENQTDMVVKFDKEGRLLFVSPSYCKIFGKSQDELIGKKFMPLIHKEDRKKVAELLNNVYKPPYTAYVEERALTKDGWRWQAWISTAVLNNKKQVEAVVGVGRDITEQKIAEEKLQDSEDKHRTLLENLPQKIFLKDKKSVYISCNENFARDLKIKPEEIAGKRDSDFFPAKLARQYRLDDKQILESGDTREIDEKYIEDGQERIVHTVKTPVKDAKGNVIGILGVFWDVTELRKAEEELSEYREKMAHAEQLASLGTLSATLAHELNQPLTAIRLSIENSLADLETTSSPGSVIEDLKDSLIGISDADSIVKRLSNIARKSSRKIINEVNLKTVAERIVRLLNGSARRARVSMQLKGMEKLPIIYSNEKDLEQLFFALIENAIQAADGKKNRRLIISGGVKDKRIELQFADTCGGIKSENLDRIFEPFFTTRPSGEGTGLGLCIVDQIVSGAGGRIRVESKAGKGSTFFVTLPIKIDKRS